MEFAMAAKGKLEWEGHKSILEGKLKEQSEPAIRGDKLHSTRSHRISPEFSNFPT